MARMTVKEALAHVLKDIALMSKEDRARELAAHRDLGVAPVLRDLHAGFLAGALVMEYPLGAQSRSVSSDTATHDVAYSIEQLIDSLAANDDIFELAA